MKDVCLNYDEAMKEFKNGKLVSSEFMSPMCYLSKYTKITKQMKNGKWYLG